jgi:hypothetical protein
MSTLDGLARWLRTPKTVGLLVATALAIAAAYATALLFPSSDVAFLVIIALGVSTPSTLENYGLLPDSAAGAAGVALAGCLAHWVVFLALYVAAASVAGQLVAAGAAFVVTVLAGGLVGRSLGEPSME